MSIVLDKNWERALKVLAKMTTGKGFKTLYLWGVAGTGKTWAAYQTAHKYYAITLTPETPMAELRGFHMPVGKEFKWVDGPVISAMREGARVVLNEISHAGPDVMSFLHPVLEGKGTCRITLPTGETVKSEEGFHVVATDNYPLEDLPGPLQDRFNAQICIDTYSPGGLAGLGERIRAWASKAEVAMRDGRGISLRNWYALESSLEQGFGLEESCLLVFGEDKGGNIYTGLRASDILKEEKTGVKQEDPKETQEGLAGSVGEESEEVLIVEED